MKKLFSMIIITAMLLSALALNAGAADEFAPEDAVNLFEDAEVLYLALENVKTVDAESDVKVETRAELEAVLLTGYKYYNTFHNIDGYSVGVADKFDILIHPGTKNSIMTKQFSIKNPNGTTENVEYEYWYMLDKYDFKTFESGADVRQQVGSCFAEDYVDDFLTYDKVIDAESGDVKIINLFEDSTDGKVIMCYEFGYDGLKYQYTDFQISEMNENSATATVTLSCVTRQMPYDLSTPFGSFFKDEPGWLPSVETVEFTKTADGWRISGGTMFAVMLGESEPSDVRPPNTGDETAILIALLALSGLALVCVPRKRRKQ